MAKKKKATPSKVGRKRKLINYSKRPEGVTKKTVGEVRPGTKRAKLLELMLKPNGATFEELVSKSGFDRKNTSEAIRLINAQVGYIVKEDNNGRIKAS